MPRTIRLNGVSITPKWDWSKDYRKWVAADCAKVSWSRDATEESARTYARWLAARDGIEIPSDRLAAETVKGDVVWSRNPAGKLAPSAVVFSTPGRIERRCEQVGPGRKATWRHWEERIPGIRIVIDIPNWDRVPTVEEVQPELIAA